MERSKICCLESTYIYSLQTSIKREPVCGGEMCVHVYMHVYMHFLCLNAEEQDQKTTFQTVTMFPRK